MRKRNKYYLVARDRKTNEFQLLPVKDTLEDIDLVTTSYGSALEMASILYLKNIIKTQDVDFYIVSPRKVGGKLELKTMEVLYQNSRDIRPIAVYSKNKQLSESVKEVETLLKRFCNSIKYDNNLYNFVVFGNNDLYKKFVAYYEQNDQIDYNELIHKDGGWVASSYPLIRTIEETQARLAGKPHNTIGYSSFGPTVYRDALEEDILEVTKEGYDENQYTLFDVIEKESIEISDELLEVMNTIEHLERDTFILDVDGVFFNDKLFENYEDKDYIKLKTLLGRKLSMLIQIYILYKEKLSYIKSYPQEKKIQELADKTKRRIIKLLSENKKLLEKASEWCKLYEKYKEGQMNKKNGLQYKKGN